MAGAIEPRAHDIAWVGARAGSGESLPGTGSWEIVDHAGCDGNGMLRAMGRRTRAPRCPRCGQTVMWQLSHLATSVAVDHRGVGHLP